MTHPTDDVLAAIEQAIDCIRGETPEDCSDEEARSDTLSKLRGATDLLESQAKALRDAEANIEHLEWAIESLRIEDEAQDEQYEEMEARALTAEAERDIQAKALIEATEIIGDLRLAIADCLERATAAEARLKEAEKVIKPFSIAADDLDDVMLNRSEIWECPAAMNINAGHLRAARAFLGIPLPDTPE